MKKNWLFYLLVIACIHILVTSCSKDDPADNPPVEEPTWKNSLGTYTPDESHKLIINGKEDGLSKSKTVTLAAETGENAKITLTNIVPDNATVEINNVTMIRKDDKTYTFTAETTVNETVISVSGTLSAENSTSAALTVDVNRKINSPLAGTWKLGFSQMGANIVLNARSMDADFVGACTVLRSLLSGLLAQKVTDVTVSLGGDGLFDVKWTDTGKDTPTGMPDEIKSLVSVSYFVEDGQLYLAFEKSLLETYLPLLTAMIPEGLPIDVNAILGALTEERGDFVTLPIGYKQTEDGGTVFYVGKTWGGVLAPILTPLLAGNLPEEIKALIAPVLEKFPELIAGAETFEVGLGFNK
ncbi:MAG: DUF4925 domain-containing protein [Tannerellaceae bacterium]|jgi:hypothetical protein|nr:DUF4925 domain-containing protein [Tannerellaceae bacterium]